MTVLSILHVIFGSTAVVAGATALAARKGSGVHRAAGRVFVAAMLVCALLGTWAAVVKPEMITALAGVFTCYLAASAWATVQPPSRALTMLSVGGLILAAGIGASGLIFGREALAAASGLKDGYPSEPYFFFGGLAILAALLDISVLVRRGVSGAQRIARHLWRMGFALYIAVGSLFTGPGASALPEGVRGSWLLSLPELGVGVLILTWLAITLFTKRFRAASTSFTPP
jgi:uncharacterized membrane protein